jgi:site-specific DNA-cytosine methylase
LIIENKPTYTDLFTGAGWLSEVFMSARFELIAHVEMNKDTCVTLKKTALDYFKHNKIKEYRDCLKGSITRK